MERNAVITLAIGESFQAIAKLTHPSMRSYARRIGAEFVCKRNTARALPHYEKFCLGEYLQKYDRIVYLDSDLIVSGNCPNLFELVPKSEIGAYDEGLLASEEERKTHKAVMDKACLAYGIEPSDGRFFNTGVMVLSREHSEVFRNPHKEIAIEYSEQPLMNIRFRSQTVRDIGYLFNRMPYVDGRVEGNRIDGHIVHYAGLTNVGELVKKDLETWSGRRMALEHPITPYDRRTMLDAIGINGKSVVEIGTYKGEYAKEILARGPSCLWLIDPWESQPDSVYPPSDYANETPEEFDAMYVDIMDHFSKDPRVRVLRGYSYQESWKFPNESVDMVYIDAVHMFESVFADAMAWFPKVKNGGWLCGHDYTGKFTGVKQAVTAFCRLTGQELSMLTLEDWASWGIRKK